MRRFFALSFLFLLFTCPSLLLAQSLPETVPTARLYSDAARLLQKGRDYSQSIDLLEAAAKQEPQNAAYHSALGCAYAGRAVVLLRAARQARRREDNQTEYKWAQNYRTTQQKKPNNDVYDRLPPLPPVPVTTIDDDLPFSMQEKESKPLIAALTEKAVHEWETAVTAASTAAEKAEASYLQGWGTAALRVNYYGQIEPPAPVPTSLSRTVSLDALRAATTLAPENAVYWQARGDMAILQSFSYSENEPPDWKAARHDAMAAYQKSAALHSNNALVWYMRFSLAFSDSIYKQTRDLTDAERYLHEALRVDKSNAYLWYQWAFLQKWSFSYANKKDNLVKTLRSGLTEAQWLQILATVEKGNRASRFRIVTAQPELPALLAPLWRYCDHEQSQPIGPVWGFMDWVSIFSGNASENAQFALQNKKLYLALRWSAARYNAGKTIGKAFLNGASPISASQDDASMCQTACSLLSYAFNDMKNAPPGSGAAVVLPLQEQARLTAFLNWWRQTYDQSHRAYYYRLDGEAE